ncbi:MAG TPA: hypothetical protein VNE39_22940 [Planctomycetota bacterium]|nr:hypothetical protein [Planctomycetota bacterium]
MLTRERAEEILRTLTSLPSDKVAEVADFALFLKARCGPEGEVDEDDAWGEADLRDVTLAVLAHAERAMPGNGPDED